MAKNGSQKLLKAWDVRRVYRCSSPGNSLPLVDTRDLQESNVQCLASGARASCRSLQLLCPPAPGGERASGIRDFSWEVTAVADPAAQGRSTPGSRRPASLTKARDIVAQKECTLQVLNTISHPLASSFPPSSPHPTSLLPVPREKETVGEGVL